MATLSEFLKENKAKFLADVEKDGAQEWTIVMGNEAGGTFWISDRCTIPFI